MPQALIAKQRCSWDRRERALSFLECCNPRELFRAQVWLQACTLFTVDTDIKFMPVSAWYWCCIVAAAKPMSLCKCVTPLWRPKWQGASTLDAPQWL
jgi:hypothetical protein